MITNIGAVLIKEAELYGPTEKALLAGAEALQQYAARAAGKMHPKSQQFFRQTIKAHEAFLNAAAKELKPVSKKYPHIFYMGDVGGHEIYGNMNRLAEIPRKRLGQMLNHSQGMYSDLSPEELHELFTLGFQSDPNKVLKGISFSSDEFRKRLAAYKNSSASNKLSNKDIVNLLKSSLKKLENIDTYDKYKANGVNNMFVSTPDIVTKSGHRPSLFTTPIYDKNEFGDASNFVTLYKMHPRDIRDQQQIGRIVEPLKLYSSII